jgi:fucose 4-O-acetylase-like acetyltransferase
MEKLGKLSLTIYLIHFPVAIVYFNTLYMLKRTPAARSLPAILMQSGGSGLNYQSIPLSIGDIVMYIPLIIIASLIVNLIAYGIKTLASYLWRKKPKKT